MVCHYHSSLTFLKLLKDLSHCCPKHHMNHPGITLYSIGHIWFVYISWNTWFRNLNFNFAHLVSKHLSLAQSCNLSHHVSEHLDVVQFSSMRQEPLLVVSVLTLFNTSSMYFGSTISGASIHLYRYWCPIYSSA